MMKYPLLLSILLLSGCASKGSFPPIATASSITPSSATQPNRDVPEMVMSPGMTITVRNANGTMSIEAGDDLWRRFRWDDYTVKTRLDPRRNRWNGSHGAYDPGDTWFLTTAVVMDEGRHFFDSIDAAMRDLYVGSAVRKPVWTKDGLVVSWHYIAGDVRVGVEVHQIYINGQKPTDLPGAREDLLIVVGQMPPEYAEPAEVEVGSEAVPGRERLVLDAPYSPLD